MNFLSKYQYCLRTFWGWIGLSELLAMDLAINTARTQPLCFNSYLCTCRSIPVVLFSFWTGIKYFYSVGWECIPILVKPRFTRDCQFEMVLFKSATISHLFHQKTACFVLPLFLLVHLTWRDVAFSDCIERSLQLTFDLPVAIHFT